MPGTKKTGTEYELFVMSKCAFLLSKLSAPARTRVINWIVATDVADDAASIQPELFAEHE